jgi:glycerol kinase
MISALGAAYLAGLAVGFWKDIEEISTQWREDKKFTPSMDANQQKGLIAQWLRAIKATLAWSTDVN